MMKLSEDQVNTENQSKKRKRESASIENTDDVDSRSPSKRNKRSTHHDSSLVVPAEESHSKDTSVAKNDSSLRGTNINTELIRSALNPSAESSNIADIQCQSSPKRNKKKKKKGNEIAPEIDLVSSSNATLSSNSNEADINMPVVGSLNDISQAELSSPKKTKKNKRKSVEIQEIDTVSSNNSILSCLSSNPNEENINKSTIDSSNDVSQLESSSPKKKSKRRKTNRIDDDNLNESDSTLINDSITNTSSSELVESTDGILPRKARKRKIRTNDENTSESVSSSNSTSVPDTTDPNLLPSDDKSFQLAEAASPRKARKNRTKVDKNPNISEPVLPTSSENISSTSDVPSKPLKSCLKKKKRKPKKKKNLKRQSTDSNIEEDKKASNRSVTFDDNLKIEEIENCLVKVEAQNARKKDKALAYLKRWKAKQNWKFEKLTQSWLLKNMFREDLIPAEEFKCLVEYMVDLKGAARTLVDDLCEKVITNVGEKVPEEEEKELLTAYTRARAVLQRLS